MTENLRVSLIEYLVNANLAIIFILTILLVLVCINPLFGKRQTGDFIFAIIIVLFAIIAVSFDTYFTFARSMENAYLHRRITSFLNFSLSPIVPLLLLRISTKDKLNKWVLLPAAINSIACFLSIFFNVVFFISAKNTYDRGPFFLLPIIVSFLYVVLIILGRGKNQTHSRQSETVFLAVAIILLSLGMLLEIWLYARFIVWNIAGLIVVMYYLILNINDRITDALTGLYNRAMYTRAIEKVKGTRDAVVAILDINDFKSVNDNFGHEKGDVFLINFSKYMERHFFDIATSYRIGGDEFFCIGNKNVSLKKFDAVLAEFKMTCEANQIFFACGKAMYEKTEDIYEVLRDIDKKMYENKKEKDYIDLNLSLSEKA